MNYQRLTMTKKIFLFFTLLTLSFMLPTEASAKKKRRIYKKKWSISLTNGYTAYTHKKGSVQSPTALDEYAWGRQEGQMHSFFSSLDIARNFGYYEIGAKIQNLGPAFVSPFFKLNMRKNNSRAKIIPSITLGVVPALTMGSWLRVSLSLALNRYISFTPFGGIYGWYNTKDEAGDYLRWNFHVNGGLSINLYY